MEEGTSSKKYDVFLSFRGVDTRDTITSHIYEALCDRKINTFKDDPDLRKGDEISEALFNAIEVSDISLIVFSKSYASSRWCLEELVKILQCKDKHRQIVIPVFYGVEPTVVRNQTGSYAESFAGFEASNKHLDKLLTWKDALKKAGGLSGYCSLKNKPEALLVKNVVQEVSERLSIVCSHEKKGLIGIDSRINKIKTSLVSNRSLGIWGVGGIGKTTLAMAVFDKISHQFEGSCFLRNVRQRFKKGGGLADLQREFYKNITGNKCTFKRGYAFEKRMLQCKLLIVLDDVADFQQVNELISMEDLECLDSRVIVTSRDSQVLRNCGVNDLYRVEVLSRKDAIELFRRHALKGNQPMQHYEELSHKFVDRLGCLPLALQVIGSSLQNKSKRFWESSLKKLEEEIDPKIDVVLKISYDGLGEKQKKIFLDIVYLFNGDYEDQICQYLSYYEFVEDEIEILIDKSLLIKLDDNKIIIHDLLQDMGRTIERNKPSRTRFSDAEDFHEFLNKSGQVINGIQCISIDMCKVNMSIEMDLDRFFDIKILELYYSGDLTFENKIKVNISEVRDFRLYALRKFCWWGCPLKSLPSKFHPKHLVTFSTPYSEFKKLWDGVLYFPHLKEISLGDCKHLTTCPDLSGVPNLKHLYLAGCESLTFIPDCFAGLTSLVRLNMCFCSSLQRLPDLSGMESLEELFLYRCSSLVILPELPSNLNKLRILDIRGCSKIHKLLYKIGALESLSTLFADETAIRDVPPSFGNLPNLAFVDFPGCELQDSMNSLVDALSVSCSTLEVLNLRNCAITAIPDSLGRLSTLRKLFLGGNHFESIPASIINLSNLDLLEVCNCKKLNRLPEIQSMRIKADNCSSLKLVHKLYVPDHGESYFSFNDCFNLCLDEFDDVVEDFLHTLPSLASCYRTEMHSKEACFRFQYQKEAYHRSRSPKSACMSYPGSKIPKWFSSQCAGSTITLKLPRKVEGKIFVGFSVCAVIDVGLGMLEYIYTLTSKDGQGRTFSEFLLFKNAHDVETDHLHIAWAGSMYPTANSRDLCELCYDSEVTFKFRYWKGIEPYKLKSCGVHPMYAENLKNSDESFDSSESDENFDSSESYDILNENLKNSDENLDSRKLMKILIPVKADILNESLENSDENFDSSESDGKPHPERLKISTTP